MYPMFFDAHCDTASLICDKKESLFQNKCHIDLKRLCAYSGSVICFAAYIAPAYANDGYNRYRQIADYLDFQISNNSDYAMRCYDKKDVAAALNENKTAAVLTVEGGGEVVGSNVCLLDELKKNGVFAMTLTWNHDNVLATGCATKTHHRGLSNIGMKVVKRMNEIGILVDVSHASQQTFWEIISCTKQPVIASHSDSKAVFDDKYERNLYDDQFMAICDSGGVCGINLYPDFLSEGNAKISDVIRHIEHYLSLGGENNVGFGFDFDGIEKTPAGICDVSDVYKIMNELAKLGYGDELLNKIFYGNFMRVFNF